MSRSLSQRPTLQKAGESTKIPGALITLLEMVKAFVFGDSYGKNTNQGADSNTLYPDRLALRHHFQSLTNYAVAGTRMDQILSSIQTSWVANGRGIAFVADGCINDEKQYADTTGTPTTAAAFRSALAHLAAWSNNNATSAAFIYGPSWSAGTTSTAGAYADFAFSGDSAYLLTNFVTGSGGTLTVKNSAGTTLATITTGGFKQAFTGATKISGQGAGNHTLRVSLTSGTATLAGVIVPGAYPPAVAWVKPGRFNNVDAEWTRLQAYLAACDTVAAEFSNVIPVGMDSDWDYTTMISADFTHPNDRGVTYITNRVESVLRDALTWRQGLHWLTSATNTASNGAYTIPPVSYAVTGATAPAQVTGLTANTGNIVALGWTLPTDGGATLTGFIIQASLAGANSWSTVATPAATATSIVIASGLTSATSYDFRIAATNSVGTGTYSATATATTGTPPTTYAADTFTRADSASLGSTETGAYAWTSINPTYWSISGNKLSAANVVSPTAPNDTYISDGQADGTVSATRGGTGVNCGLVVRASGAGNANGYIFWLSGTSTWTLSKRTAVNAYTALATATVTPAVGDIMSVVLNGSSIVCKINGVTVITVTDATYTGTKHGLWMNANGAAITWDDFSHTSAIA